MFIWVFVDMLVWFGLFVWFGCLFNLFFHEVYRKLSKKLTAVLSRHKTPCISRRNKAFSYNFPVVCCTRLLSATTMLLNNNLEIDEQVYPVYSRCKLAEETRQIIYLPFHILLWLHYLLQGKQQSPKHYRRKDVWPSVTVTFEITRGSAEITGL